MMDIKSKSASYYESASFNHSCLSYNVDSDIQYEYRYDTCITISVIVTSYWCTNGFLEANCLLLLCFNFPLTGARSDCFRLCEMLVSGESSYFSPGEFYSCKMYRLEDINENVTSYAYHN